MAHGTLKAASQRLTRILAEGYGPGAWHGPDLKAALADVGADLAYRRPAAGRHNIAEIAVHHAWCLRSALPRFGRAPEPFPLEGDDWFDLPDPERMAWKDIVRLLEETQDRLIAAAGSNAAPGGEAGGEPLLDLVLGLTCHAVYHAGQIQLIKRLLGPEGGAAS